jgi:hypothetical protein
MFDMDSNQAPTSLTSPMGALATTITVASASGFLNDELILVTDNTNTTADLYQISGTPAGTTIPLSTSSYNVHPGFPAGGYLSSPAALVAKARFTRYYIDSTTDPAHPTLMVQRMGNASPQPLAEDIEDMQLEFGIDTSAPADGIVDSFVANPATLSQVRQVRLQFIARTRLPEAGWSETRPALGNHAAGATTDGYRRRTYDLVLDVRNSGV